jgi:hypothetical protein
VACSGCGRRSSRVHARYQRQLADLPLGGRRVLVIAQVRRFKCASPRCGQSTFSEQIPGLTTPFARRTPPLTGALIRVALALAGRPGSRLAAGLGMPSCRDVLIRLIRAQPIAVAGHIEVLGVDDFAVRRGQSYNTILIDMGTHKPVDVLPGREAGTLAGWLREHPRSRRCAGTGTDRASAYAVRGHPHRSPAGDPGRRPVPPMEERVRGGAEDCGRAPSLPARGRGPGRAGRAGRPGGSRADATARGRDRRSARADPPAGRAHPRGTPRCRDASPPGSRVLPSHGS